ncbi:MAG: diguanylate cyclase [Noviherbaspirillum sp.]
MLPIFKKICRRPSPKPVSLSLALSFLILLVCGSLIASTAALGWKSRTEWLNNARTATENLSYSVAQHAEATFSQTDSIVLDIIERIERDGIGADRLPYLKTVLLNKVAQQPQLHGLFVYDETGRWVVHSQSSTPSMANNADRSYFQYHRANAGRAVHIGVPIRSRSTNEWIVPVSRRLSGPGGDFAGVVLATIKLNHFNSYHQQFNIGENGLIAMNLASGETMIRRPFLNDGIGTSLANTMLYKEYFSRHAHGVVTSPSPLDGIERQYAYRRLEHFPVVIITATPVRDILAGWRQRMILQSSFVLALICVVGGGGAALVRQLRLQAVAKKRLSESFTKIKNLELALDEHAILAITDTKHQIIYVNDRFCAVSRYAREELIGQDAGIVNSGFHSAAFLANIRSTIAGGNVWKGETKYRAKDGSFYWCSSTVVPFLDEQGKPYQYVAIRTDITAQKQAEEQLIHAKAILEQNNAHLTLLSGQDGLTGLSNRREFDSVLQEEINRANRGGTSLALLMIDVDFFKKYNDRYGHPAGDVCLQQVAHALTLNTKRPGDLAARYGGEEFAVLLPNTGLDGAKVLADQIQSTLRQLLLPHADNPFGIVTISTGFHALVPGIGKASGAELIKAADQALYAAKAAGRNTSVSAKAMAAHL